MAQKEVNYLCIAQQFTYRGDYETHLTKDLGLRPGAPAWESAIRAFELKEHLDAARRRRDRAPKDLSEERQLIEIAEKRTLQVAEGVAHARGVLPLSTGGTRPGTGFEKIRSCDAGVGCVQARNSVNYSLEGSCWSLSLRRSPRNSSAALLSLATRGLNS